MIHSLELKNRARRETMRAKEGRRTTDALFCRAPDSKFARVAYDTLRVDLNVCEEAMKFSAYPQTRQDLLSKREARKQLIPRGSDCISD